jgi:lysophospholipase L1-like esterase
MGREFSFTSPDLAPDDTARVRGSQLLGLVLDNRPSKTLRIAARRMEIFGAIGESNEPGLVLDALGINGARIRTMLAWDEGTWLGELAERDPALVVLAYGTNEAGDGVAVDGYAEDYRNVLGRVRVGVPEADCLLVGPTDRGDDHPTAPRRAIAIDEMQREVAAELGCAYFSLVQAMGGPGGFARWAVRKPALASADGVHLTVDGYRELAKALSDQLVAAYEAPRIDTTAGRF